MSKGLAQAAPARRATPLSPALQACVDRADHAREVMDLWPWLTEDERAELLAGAGGSADGPGLWEYTARMFPGTFAVARHHLLLFQILEAVERGEITRLMLFAPPRHGKLVADETPILTAKGWVTHGELKVGDYVFHPSGRRIQVVRVFAPGEAKVRTEWANGEVIWCHAAHEWRVFDPGAKAERVAEAGDLVGLGGLLVRRPGWSVGLDRVSVDPTSERIGRCIQVDAADGMYCVGRTLIPTHNSTMTTVHFPAWYLGRNPDKRVMVITHGDDLSAGFGRQIRNQIEDPMWPYPDVRLAGDESASKRWSIAGRRGGCFAAGIGGSIIGRGANLMILDDLVKDRAEADSPLERAKLLSRYENNLYYRLEPDAAVILMMHRWHQADIAGALLDRAQADPLMDQWTVVDLPALAHDDEPDLLGRQPGEALWRDRYSEEALAKIKANGSTRGWVSTWQQRPGTTEGLKFKRTYFARRYRDLASLRIDRVLQVVDSASSLGEANSRTAIATWFEGYHDGQPVCGILGAWVDRVEFPELIKKLISTNEHWSDKLKRSVPLYIENKSSGIAAIQTLQRDTRLPVIAWEPPARMSKDDRAEAATYFYAALRVMLPEHGPWVDDFIEEHVAYPTAKTNDLVDTSGMALDILYNLQTEEPPPEGMKPSDWIEGAKMAGVDLGDPKAKRDDSMFFMA